MCDVFNGSQLTNEQLWRADSVFIFSGQVADVAKAIINAVKDPDANGKTFALVG